ncbi:type II toxin-antitoxin system VapC family toxin [Taklimakanibacter lacteus]|uniref:type II toxin-antitoxin system VapC family toxin n=1 Tax=Taklimakanibacter lacteus TaxID=2268456 RepID=UPI000E673CF0
MIVLDTNVLSEMLRVSPEPRVAEWLNDQPRASIFTTTVTRGELLYGIRVLPAGKRRDQLWDAVIRILDIDMAGQVLTFDSLAADEFAQISATRRATGRPISQFDAQIAGITRSRGAQLATRNASDFDACGFDVINPWLK